MSTPSPLPGFRFHPDPVQSGSVGASKATCVCCGKPRGWIYRGPVYAAQKLNDAVCPWCIADGSAFRKLRATFVDCEAFDEGTADSTLEEICTRTPGFETFQSERWPSCCGEPGRFVTPAGRTEIQAHFPSLENDLVAQLVTEGEISAADARRVFNALARDQSPTAFVFQCHSCARHFGYVDDV